MPEAIGVGWWEMGHRLEVGGGDLQRRFVGDGASWQQGDPMGYHSLVGCHGSK